MRAGQDASSRRDSSARQSSKRPRYYRAFTGAWNTVVVNQRTSMGWKWKYVDESNRLYRTPCACRGALQLSDKFSDPQIQF